MREKRVVTYMDGAKNAIKVIINADQTVVYSSSRLPKPQLVGYLYTFPTDRETLKLWNGFTVEKQDALIQQAITARKDIRLLIQESIPQSSS
jgi:hypothetical protein